MLNIKEAKKVLAETNAEVKVETKTEVLTNGFTETDGVVTFSGKAAEKISSIVDTLTRTGKKFLPIRVMSVNLGWGTVFGTSDSFKGKELEINGEPVIASKKINIRLSKEEVAAIAVTLKPEVDTFVIALIPQDAEVAATSYDTQWEEINGKFAKVPRVDKKTGKKLVITRLIGDIKVIGIHQPKS